MDRFLPYSHQRKGLNQVFEDLSNMHKSLPGGCADMETESSEQLYSKVKNLLREHHKWFDSSIPLIASENVPSPSIRAAVASDFGNRYAEGWPGE